MGFGGKKDFWDTYLTPIVGPPPRYNAGGQVVVPPGPTPPLQVLNNNYSRNQANKAAQAAQAAAAARVAANNQAAAAITQKLGQAVTQFTQTPSTPPSFTPLLNQLGQAGAIKNPIGPLLPPEPAKPKKGVWAGIDEARNRQYDESFGKFVDQKAKTGQKTTPEQGDLALQYRYGLVGTAQGAPPGAKVKLYSPAGDIKQLPQGAGLRNVDLPTVDALKTIYDTGDQGRAREVVRNVYFPGFTRDEVKKANEQLATQGGFVGTLGDDQLKAIQDKVSSMADEWLNRFADNFFSIAQKEKSSDPYRIAQKAKEKTGPVTPEVVTGLNQWAGENRKGLSAALSSAQVYKAQQLLPKPESHGTIHNLLFGGLDIGSQLAEAHGVGAEGKKRAKQTKKEIADAEQSAILAEKGLGGFAGLAGAPGSPQQAEALRQKALLLETVRNAGAEQGKLDPGLLKRLAGASLGLLDIASIATLPLGVGGAAKGAGAVVETLGKAALKRSLSAAEKNVLKQAVTQTAGRSITGATLGSGIGAVGAFASGQPVGKGALQGALFGGGAGALFGGAGIKRPLPEVFDSGVKGNNLLNPLLPRIGEKAPPTEPGVGIPLSPKAGLSQLPGAKPGVEYLRGKLKPANAKPLGPQDVVIIDEHGGASPVRGAKTSRAVPVGKIVVEGADYNEAKKVAGAKARAAGDTSLKGTVLEMAKTAEAANAGTRTRGGKIGHFDVLNRIRNQIEKVSPKAAAIIKAHRETEDVTGKFFSKQLKTLPKLKNLSKVGGVNEQENFAMAAHGLEEPANPKVAKALKEWKAVSEQIQQEREFLNAQGYKVDKGRIEDYFPIRLKNNVENKQSYSQLLSTVMEREGISKEEAHKVLRGYQGNATIETNPLQFRRHLTKEDIQTHRELFRLDSNVPIDYIGDFAKLRADALHYVGKEKSLKNADRLYSALEEGAFPTTKASDLRYAQKLVKDHIIGTPDYSSRSMSLSRKLRAFNVLTKLGLGALSNVQQVPVNTLSWAGWGTSAKGLVKALANRKDAKEFLDRTAVTSHRAIGQLQTIQAGTEIEGAIKYGAPGFSVVERGNRATSSWIGREYVNKLARLASKDGLRGNYARRNLKELGLTNIDEIAKRGSLTLEEEVRGARKFVEKTQFLTDPQDLPATALSPAGRVLAQYKTFSYNQTSFVARQVIGEAAKGNIGPLLRYATATTLVGTGVYELRQMIRHLGGDQKKIPTAEHFLRGVFGAGGLGLPSDLAQNLTPYSKYESNPDALLQAIGELIGPTGGSALELAGGALDAVRGVPGKPSTAKRFEKSLLRHVPVIGPTVANALFPSKDFDKLKEGKVNDLAAVIKNNIDHLVNSGGAFGATEGLTDDESKLLAKMSIKVQIDGGSQLFTIGLPSSRSELDRELRNNFKDDASARGKAIEAYLKYANILGGVRKSVLDNKELADKIDQSTLPAGQYEADIKLRKIHDQEIDESIAGGYTGEYLANLDQADLQYLYQSNQASYQYTADPIYKQRADAIGPLINEYVGGIVQTNRSNVDTSIEKYAKTKEAKENILALPIPEEVTRLAKADAGERIKALEQFPPQNLPPLLSQAISYTQSRADQGLIAPSTAKGTIKSLNKLSAGDFSTGGSGGGGGGKRRGGKGRKGSSGKTTIKIGKPRLGASRKPSFKKTGILPQTKKKIAKNPFSYLFT